MGNYDNREKIRSLLWSQFLYKHWSIYINHRISTGDCLLLSLWIFIKQFLPEFSFCGSNQLIERDSHFQAIRWKGLLNDYAFFFSSKISQYRWFLFRYSLYVKLKIQVMVTCEGTVKNKKKKHWSANMITIIKAT